MTTIKPWREVIAPHEDVLKGTFQQAEFAADLSRVHEGTASAEYQDPALFYQRTFITEGMRLLLDSVAKRLSGKGGDPVIQLQTAFGGGKTHTMLAVYHLATGKVPCRDLPGVLPILEAAGIKSLPKARIAVLDGNQLSPNQPQKHGNLQTRTIWGELAWQLGGAAAYEMLKEADQSGTSPGKKVFAEILTQCAPCVILIDELVAYIRQFEDGKTLSGGTFDSNLSFVQALTEALKAVPNAVLLAALPESEKEAGSQKGVSALRALEHYFARVQAIWKPVATEEAFEIVRRRLFHSVSNPQDVEAVCRSFADFYSKNGGEFPQETQDSNYFRRLTNAYPIHPEVFDRLYEDWSTLDNFQRTRGVLKLMAKVIHHLWASGNNDLLIMPGNLPLGEANVRNEAIYYLPEGWDPVLERDIDGPKADTTEIENNDTRLGSVQACRRTARTIFLASAPTTSSQRVRGADTGRILLGSIQPGQQIGLFQDALRRLTDRLQYLNSSDNRYWFDTRPNLRKEMEERKRRFKIREEIIPSIRERLQKLLVGASLFSGIHVFTPSNDIPDDWGLRLVVLPPSERFSKGQNNAALEASLDILKKRGEQPRQKQNRLLFLAPDDSAVDRLYEQTKSFLAWKSIVADIRDLKLNLDQLQARQAEKNLKDAEDLLKRTIRDTYKWILAPVQEAKPGKGISEISWDKAQVNPSTESFSSEIEKTLRENEYLISEWSPIHLARLMKEWFWKDDVSDYSAQDAWRKTCFYLYMPRLKDEDTFRRTLEAGLKSRDFYATAFGKDGEKYLGFNFGKGSSLTFDDQLLLIEPIFAAKYEADHLAPDPVPGPKPSTGTDPVPGKKKPGVGPSPDPVIKKPLKTRFFGTVSVNAVTAKIDFAQIVDEIIMQFSTKPGVKISISVEIQAETHEGFDEGTQRAVNENCNVLRFTHRDFEEE